MSGHCRAKRDRTGWSGLDLCANVPDEGIKEALHFSHIMLEPEDSIVNTLEFAVLHEDLVAELLAKSVFLLWHNLLETFEITAVD
jgi:hypothetical protein